MWFKDILTTYASVKLHAKLWVQMEFKHAIVKLVGGELLHVTQSFVLPAVKNIDGLM